MRFWIKLLLIVVIFCCCVVIAARVDPKLDFTEVAARVVEQKDDDNGKEVITTGNGSNVRGVRVTVETKSPESKSSESSDSSSSSGSVGVRTDVTFEISNETNETRSDEEGGRNKKKGKGNKDKKNNDDEDDIPVIKGRTSPPKKESNDITTWRPMVRPIFPKGDPDDTFRNRNNGHSNIPWTKSFPNSATWTTERNYFGLYDNYNNFNPSQPVGTHIPPLHQQNPSSHVQFYPYVIGQPTWHACRCDLLRPEPGVWSHSSPEITKNHNTNQYHYTVVDDKLDEPFSDRTRSNVPRRRESN